MTSASQKNTDDNHLRMLSVLHYVFGAISALAASVPILHLILGIVLIFNPEAVDADQSDVPKDQAGWMVVGIAAGFLLVGWTITILIILTGRFLARRRHHLYCLIIALLECTIMPLGTILGIFTLVVLLRDSVKAQFDQNQTPD